MTFPMFAEIIVQGFGIHNLWRYLSESGGEITDNWTKFLVSKTGIVMGRFEPHVNPSKFMDKIGMLCK